MNFDGSVWNGRLTSVGCVFRDDKGDVLHAGSKRGHGTSPLLTEALALHFACLEASRLGFSNIHLEDNNLNVINVVLIGREAGMWEIDLIVSEIMALFSNF